MKRIILIAAAFAALSACTKAETETVNVTEPSVGTSFEKGQTVTLNVNAGTTTKVTSELNADGQTVDFKWAAEDKIKVIVKGKYAEFTLTSGAGGSSAVFEGVMPEFGDTFDVQYPVTDPDIATQNYSSTEAIPHDMMKFTATGCSFASPSFTLTAANAALRLNLYGSKPIGKIVVSDGVESTYTLTCGEPGKGITPGTTAETATPFFIVVPAGKYKFSAEIFDNSLTPASICKFEPSAARIFTAGNVLNMPAKEVKKPLPALSGVFSVSKSLKVHFSRGNLQATYNSSTSSYSWDFAANQYDYIGETVGNTTIGSQTDGAKVDMFGWSTSATYYGISTSETNGDYSGAFKDWGIAYCESKGITPVTTWRTLSGGDSGEWKYLLSTRTVNGGTGEGKSYRSATIRSDVSGGVWGLIIYPDNYTAQTAANKYTTSEWTTMEKAGCVFLPAAGYREGSYLTGVADIGHYWSPTVYEDEVEEAYDLYFSSTSVNPEDHKQERHYGHSVRLVCVAQ